MKLRDLIYFLGLRPKPKVYPYEVVTYELPDDGQIKYAQWLHPAETKKVIRQEAVEALRKLLAPGDVAIDIGAHSGDAAVPMGLAVGLKGCVLALEPNPYVFPVLKKNLELNSDKTNIVPLMIAATPESGDVFFEYSDQGFCNGGLHEGISTWRHGHTFKLKVHGENLHNYIVDHYAKLAPRIRFVKIDVEGYDYQVLSSIRSLIASQKPFLKLEVFKLLNIRQRERLYDLLVELGYDVFLIESDFNYFGPRLERGDLMIRRHYDVFCVPEAQS